MTLELSESVIIVEFSVKDLSLNAVFWLHIHIFANKGNFLALVGSLVSLLSPRFRSCNLVIFTASNLSL